MMITTDLDPLEHSTETKPLACINKCVHTTSKSYPEYAYIQQPIAILNMSIIHEKQ